LYNAYSYLKSWQRGLDALYSVHRNQNLNINLLQFKTIAIFFPIFQLSTARYDHEPTSRVWDTIMQLCKLVW